MENAISKSLVEHLKLLLALALIVLSPIGQAKDFANNQHDFDSWFKQDITALKLTNAVIRCGNLPPVAMSKEISMLGNDLLVKAESDFGDGKGNISFSGTAQYFQAMKAIYSLADSFSEQNMLKIDKPNKETCKSSNDSSLISTLSKAIKIGY